METSIQLSWQKNMAFETELNGHKLQIDASDEVGGNNKGPRPKPLMLVALAGCTGMDVISILKKMRINVDDFDVEVVAKSTEEHPKHYTSMHLIYKFTGKNLPKDKLEKAVDLSQERYCGVSYVYKKAMDLTFEVKIIDLAK